ncbi:MAG TPA: hypothetical protein VMV46_17455 [Thermoanaerobaculia bacterium]|nr:hypothetical protein [Thermoanaerobaculia bacterium]
MTGAGDLVFRLVVAAGGGALLAGACLATARMAERQGEGLAVEPGERRARRRRLAVRCALGIGASSAVLAAPAFLWPDVSVGLTAGLIAAALVAPLPWLVALTGGPGWTALGGWLSCSTVLGGVLWLLAGSLIAGQVSPGRLEQDATLASLRQIGEAYEAWRVERQGANARVVQAATEDLWGEATVSLRGLPPLSPEELERTLAPRHLRSLPRLDGWGRPLELRGALEDSPRLVIRSAGSDGIYSGDEYAPGLLQAGSFEGDLVWADGRFVRQPAD